MSLSFEDYMEIGRKNREFMKEWETKNLERQKEELRKRGVYIPDKQETKYANEYFMRDCDSPGTLDNKTATILYVIVMAVGSIFVGNILIWIAATIIWWRHINRHEIRRKKWEKEAREKGDWKRVAYLVSRKKDNSGLIVGLAVGLPCLLFVGLVLTGVIPADTITAGLTFIAGAMVIYCFKMIIDDCE